MTLWRRCLPCCCCSICKPKPAKLCNLVPESVWKARNSVQKHGFQLTVKENDSTGIMWSQTTFKGVAFGMIQHWTELLLCEEGGTVKWWTTVSCWGRGKEKAGILKNEVLKNVRFGWLKWKRKIQILLFLALLGCRCVSGSCCTWYRFFLTITVHGNRGVIFVLAEASPVTLSNSGAVCDRTGTG